MNQHMLDIESTNLEAIDVLRSITPFAVPCLNEIRASQESATEPQRRAQLQAVDSLSFYYNATAHELPFSPTMLAGSVVAHLATDHPDSEFAPLMRSLHEENRSSEWLEQMQLVEDVRAAEVERMTPGHVTTLVLDDDRLRARSLSLDTMDVVVVAGCHIAQRAAEKLQNDPKARRLLAGRRVVWMQPAGRSMNLDELRQWNSTFPDTPMHVALRNTQWKGMDLTALPTFHVLRRGKVVASYRGWPRDGKTPRLLLKALSRHLGR
jgi:hypothetical protein